MEVQFEVLLVAESVVVEEMGVTVPAEEVGAHEGAPSPVECGSTSR